MFVGFVVVFIRFSLSTCLRCQTPCQSAIQISRNRKNVAVEKTNKTAVDVPICIAFLFVLRKNALKVLRQSQMLTASNERKTQTQRKSLGQLPARSCGG